MKNFLFSTLPQKSIFGIALSSKSYFSNCLKAKFLFFPASLLPKLYWTRFRATQSWRPLLYPKLSHHWGSATKREGLHRESPMVKLSSSPAAKLNRFLIMDDINTSVCPSLRIEASNKVLFAVAVCSMRLIRTTDTRFGCKSFCPAASTWLTSSEGVQTATWDWHGNDKANGPRVALLCLRLSAKSIRELDATHILKHADDSVISREGVWEHVYCLDQIQTWINEEARVRNGNLASDNKEMWSC